MHAGQSQWQQWAHFLQRYSLRAFVADLIDSAGPANLFLAQMVYLSQPFLRSALPEIQLKVMAEILENPSESRKFAAYLREEEIP